MSRFYVPRQAVKGNMITMRGPEAHHAVDVMRLSKSDEVVVFDGTGKEYHGTIKEISDKSLSIDITSTEEIVIEEAFSITLIQAVTKKDKMDYIVEKATELGVASIIPVFTDRTVPKWDESKMAAHAARWQKIANEASKQSGRVRVPSVGKVASFNEIIKISSGCDLALIAALSKDSVPLKKALNGFKDGSLALAIGPEGDFTPDEVAAARTAGFKLISLGRNVLKSDTAGLAALAMLNYELTP